MKKFLSLVLAVIMTMSLVTISASAAEYKDFTDKDEIQYEEAVAVLNRLGIITGYSEGDFRPEGELTRGAAAKIIASLLIGPEAAENLSPTTAPFKDVPLDHTFAGPIAYCSTLKIINGYSDGSFQPGGTLTGYAFAKMLLGALGYDSSIERFTGPGWNMNVMRLGGETGLFDRLDFKGNDPVNREQAAQLALNTLKGTMVEYTGGINVTTSDGSTMTSPANRIYKTSNQEYATHILNRKATQTGSASSTDTLWTVEFGEEHFVDLRMKTERSVQDDFGRPSNEWSYKKVTIGTYPIEADKTYTEQVAHNVITVSNASKARSLELTGNKVDKDTVITVNGKDYTTTEVKSLIGANLTDVGQIADFTDNGTVVEVYIDVDRADWVSNIVVIKTQLMEVKRLGKESVSLDLYDNGSANKGKTVFGFNQPAIDEKVDNVEIDDDYYSLLSGLKVGDLVAVVPVTTDGGSSYTVAEAYVPETVSGSLKKVNTFGTSSMSTEIKNVVYAGKNESTIGVTVGDTAYNIALWNKDLVDVDGDKLEVTTKDVTLTLDKFGNALLAKDVGATSDFMIVGSYYQNLVNGKLMNYVKGWDISGEELSLNLGSKRSVLPENSGYQPGDLVHYTNSTSGDADWMLESTGVSDVFTDTDTAVTPNALYSIKASNSRIRIANDDPNYTYLNNNNNPWIDKGIKFIYVTFTDDGDVDSISIKNGVQAASNAELRKAWTANNSTLYNPAQLALKLKNGAVTEDSTVKAVVIKNESNDAVASNMLYIVNYAGSAGKTDNGDIVYEYTVAMNGSNGLVDDEMTIYSTKKLSRGDWARYTAEKNDDFENFYKLTGVDQRSRATSTMVANFKAEVGKEGGYPVTNNKSLVKVDPTKLYATNGTTRLNGTPSADVSYRLPFITIAKDNNLGIGDDEAANVVSLRYATWVDLTNNGIDSYEDLADLIDDGYSLNNVQVSMIFNDDSSKDNFRQVAMIVVRSVGTSTGSSGNNSGSNSEGGTWGNASYNTSIDNGDIYVSVTLTKPDWAGDNATPTVDFSIFYRGVDTNYGVTSVSKDSNGNYVGSVRVPGANATDVSLVGISPSVTWSTAKVVCNDPPVFVKDAGIDLEEISLSTSNTLTFTLPAGTYKSATVKAVQNGVAKTNDLTAKVDGSQSSISVSLTDPAQAAVELVFTLEAYSTANAVTTSGVSEPSTPIGATNVPSADVSTWLANHGGEANVGVDEMKAQRPGVYRCPEFSDGTGESMLTNGSNPFQCAKRWDDCMVLVFPKAAGSSGTEAITIIIDNEDTFKMTWNQSKGDGNSLVNIQITDSGNGYSNAGGTCSGTMYGTNGDDGEPLTGTGTHTYWVIGADRGVILTGTFEVKNDSLVL